MIYVAWIVWFGLPSMWCHLMQNPHLILASNIFDELRFPLVRSSKFSGDSATLYTNAKIHRDLTMDWASPSKFNVSNPRSIVIHDRGCEPETNTLLDVPENPAPAVIEENEAIGCY